jgi:hypothetical protein
MLFRSLLLLSTLLLCSCQQHQQQPQQKKEQPDENLSEQGRQDYEKVSAIQKIGERKYIQSGEAISSNLPPFENTNGIRHDIQSKSSTINQDIEKVNGNSKHIDSRVVIHIGPMKTGSSSIQSSMTPVLHKIEDADNYEDAGRAMEQGIETYNFMSCFRRKNATSHGAEFMICNEKSFEQVRAVALERNHNLIISAEYITSPDTDIEAIKEFLQPWKQHNVVAFYRRYYDWLISFHNEGNKKVPTPDRRPLTKFLQYEMQGQFWWNTMYLVEAVNRWKAYFDNITIINMYEQLDGDVREQFYCQALPDAPTACSKFRALKDSEIANRSKQKNPSIAMIYQDLAYYGVEDVKLALSNDQNKIEKINKMAMTDIAYMVKDHHENVLNRTKYEFIQDAIECPSDAVLNYLLMKSMDTEEALFPDYYDKQGQRELLEGFIKDRTTKLCHIDAQIVLQNDPEWKPFFEFILAE